MERNFEYVGFWKRVLAALIDAIIGFALMPVTIPLMKFCFERKTIIPELLYSVVWTIFWMWLIVRFGATPGKLVIKARIVRDNGKYLNWGQAFLRMLIPIIISINSQLMQWNAITTCPSETHINSFMEMGQVLNKYGQPFGTIGNFLCIIIYIDILVILFNKKKRAIHDFVASSFVVTKKSLENNPA
ncbi:MAG: RDD family protein [Phycisphaerae bacterium]|jgi:uncharacterized RDD family membrane protein YckC|nr:RDD family protein [Phycisphaerae bacterium]